MIKYQRFKGDLWRAEDTESEQDDLKEQSRR